MDEDIRTDCVNGLRRRPKRKPSRNNDDLYAILRGHWERCMKIYADEKQRLYVSAGIIISFISGVRLVSLFDTQVKVADEKGGGAEQLHRSPVDALTNAQGLTDSLAAVARLRRRARPGNRSVGRKDPRRARAHCGRRGYGA
ncbi:hypothetical protein FQN49_002480 [Arthroderma sp. PD_2]|nr:hypothetical protein FQN49_002480 [Arthroderma sp. PD_2]